MMTPTRDPDASDRVSLRRRSVLTPAEAAALDAELADAPAHEIIRWAHRRFGRRLAMTASFADTLMIDLATSIDPDLSVIFLDTGFHFSETLATMRRAMERYELNLTVLRPDGEAADVWERGTEACCAARKVAPLDDHLAAHADAWLSGVRRADDPSRAQTPIVSIDRRGLVKINPIAAMTDGEYDAYVGANDIIVNPLRFEGYASIGCWPCTEPAADGRAGRWAGSGKTECGLHL
jgi:phosphoadenosine phosphosulfate reductase